MLDFVIRGGTVVDGTGAPRFRGDVGVRDGRIVLVGHVDEDAREVIHADGLVVCPGFVDPHTHYDAQLFWDPFASPSNVHGVTSIIGGNCGFTIAPIKPEDADYMRRLLARVEGMPLAALEDGIEWSWRSFAEYLDRLDGKLGVNAGFLVGHCALRRYVMGPESVGREASAEQITAMQELLAESLEAGGLGFSTTLSSTHSDGDGKPVPSRWSTKDELLALCETTGQFDGTTLEGITEGCLDTFSDDEIQLFAEMAKVANRPINWNVLTVDAAAPERVPRQLGASDAAAEIGGKIVALTMPVLVPMNMSLRNFCALNLIPGWGEILGLRIPERIAMLSDPEARAEMLGKANSTEAGVFRRLADFGRYVIGDTYSKENEGLKGRVVEDIAAERGKDPFETLVEIAVNDELKTVLWPMPTDNGPDSWALRKQVWEDPRAMIGGSDAGAHLDRMFGAAYTTRFLGDMLRGRKLVPLEGAVQMITDRPARLFGLKDRGRIAEGWIADLVVFDPETIAAQPAALLTDLPGGSERLVGGSEGIAHVFVNGVETVTYGTATGATPGTVLRSGRDTETVTAR